MQTAHMAQFSAGSLYQINEEWGEVFVLVAQIINYNIHIVKDLVDLWMTRYEYNYQSYLRCSKSVNNLNKLISWKVSQCKTLKLFYGTVCVTK